MGTLPTRPAIFGLLAAIACVGNPVAQADDRPEPTYRLDVVPILSKAGCNMGACHGNLNGKGGFRLSLRGEDPTFDHGSLTREALGRRVDPLDPAHSLAYLKPAGLVPHEGGRRIVPGSAEAHALLGWIKAGAKDDRATAPKLVTLRVSPTERFVEPIAGVPPSLQLVVTARFSDGSSRDVTRQASYDLNDPTKARISPDGLVTASEPVEVVVAVRFLEGRAVSRVAFLADRPGFHEDDGPRSSPIDAAVIAKLDSLRIRPSEPAADAVFLRRVYLDAIGLLPNPDESIAFLSDKNPNKRSALIDGLVDRPEFADFWALKWADLLRNEEKTMGLKGAWSFQRWLRDKIAADAPMDGFARDLIATLGTTWQQPAASFHRTNRDPQTAAETVSQVFLGVRLQCARCHNHPFDVWTQDDYYGLAAYFSNVRRREIGNVRGDDLDSHEINGDELVFLEGPPGTIQPRTGQKLAPKPPGGLAPDLKGDRDALDDLAAWLTHDNPQFTRNLANRVWFHLIGRGVVEPVDDFRESNPPVNPALLDALSAELSANGMRLKPLVKSIMKSRTYQLSSRPNASNIDDESNFSRANVKLLPAEVLLDAIGATLDVRPPFPGAPRDVRATQLPGVTMGGSFLKTFGKPDRLLTCECERSDATTLAQAFQLINGDAVRRRLSASGNRIGRLLDAQTNDATILETLYLAALCRPPSAEERQVHLSHVAKAGDRRLAWEDVAWALMNSKEFLLRH